ncbi:MAG TPA: L-serine ammonia-lyase, iron-sulfur-dependent, subunit alpha [Clostridiales bacterium]|nr:L-serine ammonia-lyase, iron-sulfur-dependent, subunit alpha [Clostridiales bacterium]
MFTSIKELVAQAEGTTIGEIMLRREAEHSSREQALADMQESLNVMRATVHKGMEGVTSHSGMTGGNAQKMHQYLQSGHALTGDTFLRSITYALATNEVNAAMGVICASPTAGSCGVLPGVLLAAQEHMRCSDEDVVLALFCAGAIGLVVANNAMISGAAGGCQAEVGTASAMAAAALTQLRGGTPSMCAHAMAMALKNMLGLVCDPLAGLVEVPCVKRNAAGAANALTASEMALAGVESYVPWDEVIEALYKVGQSIPLALRETAQGGLADTETGRAWKRKLWSGGWKEPASV